MINSRTILCLATLIFMAGAVRGQYSGPTEVYLGEPSYIWGWDGQSSSGSYWTLAPATLSFGEVVYQGPEIIQFTFSGAGTFILTHSSATYSLTINVHVGVPDAPPAPEIRTRSCGSTLIGWSIGASPPANTEWWWENSSGQRLSSADNYTVTTPDTWYLRAKNTTADVWSERSGGLGVTVNAVVGTPTSSGPISRCGSGPITLSASPGTNANSINWYGSPSGNDQLGSAFISNLTTTTTYYAESINTSTGCKSSSRLAVTATILQLPQAGDMISLNASSQVCVGGQIDIRVINYTGIPTFDVTIGGESAVSWAAGSGNEFHYTIPPYLTGEVRVSTRSEDPGGCGAGPVSGQQLVYYAWPAPSLVSTGQDPSPLCPGNSVRLMATPQFGENIHWYSTATGGSPITPIAGSENVMVGPLISSQTYYVAPYRSGVCESARVPFTATVTPNPPNDGQISAGYSTICLNQGVVISYNPNAGNGANGTPHYFYSTNGGASWTELTQYTGQSSFTHTPTSAGTYRYLVRNKTNCGFCYDAGNTCSENNYVDVNVVGPIANGGSLSVNNGNDDACVGSAVEIKVVSPVGTPVIWVKLNGDTLMSQSAIPNPFYLPINSLGSYNVTMRGLSACNQLSQEVQSFSFDAWPTPAAPVNNTVQGVCNGIAINLTATTGSGGSGVKWYASESAGTSINSYPFTSPPRVGPFPSTTTVAHYWASSYAEGNCESARIPVTIDVYPYPVDSDIGVTGSSSVCLGSPVNLAFTGGVGEKYVFIDEGSGIAVANSTYQHTPATPGYHSYRVRNKTGCGFCGDAGVPCSYEKLASINVVSPANAGEIAGEALAIIGMPTEYSLPGVKDATNIQWFATNGTLTTDQDPSKVLATFPPGTSTLSVAVSNPTCGAGQGASLTVVADLNYLIEETLLVETTDVEAIGVMTENQKNKTIVYFDGMGRPTQTVNWKTSPNRMDIVQPNAYDQFGREKFKYLPYAGSVGDGSYRYDAVNPLNLATARQIKFYSESAPLIASDPKPYAETIFEQSPLNRVIEQGGPGASWQPDSNHKTIRTGYSFNQAGEVLKLVYNATTNTVDCNPQDRYYDEKQLYRRITTDEEDHDVLEFVNKEGKTVCKKVQAGVNVYASTYYVYDMANNLMVVLPPEAVNTLITTIGN